MPLSSKFIWLFLLTSTASAAPEVTPQLRFESQDDQNTRWSVRGSAEATVSAGQITLAGRGRNLLTIEMIGASRFAPMRGGQPLPSHSAYYRGRDPKQWRHNVRHFARLRAAGIYPGIDAEYYQGLHGLEADFIVSGGAPYSRIQLRFSGRRITLDDQGNLRDKNSGELLMAAPAAYEIDEQGSRVSVSSRFRLLARDRASFSVARRNLSRTLVIDPTLSFGTYLGGSGSDTAVAVERGSDGRVYVAGNTTSVDLPDGLALGSLLERPVVLSNTETFVACYSPDGSTLAYVVYVGGDGPDTVSSMAVDSQGRATVAGNTGSFNFPTTPGALSPSLAGRAYDGFVYRVSSDGSTLEYSTFLGVATSSYSTYSQPVAFFVGVDATGAATVGGTASGSFGNATGSITINPTRGVIQSKSGGGGDVILLRLKPDGTGIQWATYYGGSRDEVLLGMAVDAAGNVILAGSTTSSDLPLQHPFQTAPPTNYGPPSIPSYYTAGFFAKIAPDASSIGAASYFGGQSSSSSLTSVTLDDTEAIYLAGNSSTSATPGLTEASPPPTYPVTPPTAMVKLDPTGTSPQFMWAYSALTAFNVRRVRVDGAHRPCLLSSFVSLQPTAGAILTPNAGAGPAFACFGDDGKTVQYATTVSLGGMAVADFALDPSGTIIGAASGSVQPGNGAPVTTANAPQPSLGGATDSYIFKIQPDNPAPQLYYVNPALVIAPVSTVSPIAFTFVGANFASGAAILWNGAPISVSNQFYNNSTLLSGNISGAALSTLPKGNAQIQVSIPGPGGGVSAPVTIQYINSPPVGLSITPSVVPVGNGATTFTISGSLTPDCSVTWNGATQVLTPGTNGQNSFQFTVPASAFAAASDNIVVASNPTPGGGSSTVHVAVTASGLPAPVPTITSPVVVGIGQGGSTQTLTAMGASSDAVVVWNGSDRPTTFAVSTTVFNASTLQFVLSLNDLRQMGSAQVQIRSGGVLGPAVTAYIGLPVTNYYDVADPTRNQVYFASAKPGGLAQLLMAAAIPSGNITQALDLGTTIVSLLMSDDGSYLWATTADGRISRVRIDSFTVDVTANVPGSPGSSSFLPKPTVITVAGTSSTIVAAGVDGIVRIFDGGVQRGFSTAAMIPAAPSNLIPVFATPNTVWATVGSGTGCMVELTYDYTGFSSFAETCDNSLGGPWGLPSADFKVDAGVTYFQSGSHTLVWSSPRGGYVDLANRRIFALSSIPVGNTGTSYATLGIFNMDSETLAGIVPPSGSLPQGNLVLYTKSQALFGSFTTLLLLNLPGS